MTKTTNTTWRRLLGLIVLIIAMCTTTTVAFAAEVRSISLRVVSNGDLELPDIESRSSRYEVTDVSWNKTDNLEAGDTVTATVNVSPTDGNILYIFDEDDIEISGSGAELRSYKRNGYDFEITIRYTIKGNLSEPEDAYWDEDDPWIARWSRVSNASKYEVRIYEGSNRRYSVTTRSTNYNFIEELTSSSVYEDDNIYFRVRAISDNDSDNSEWIESEELNDDDWYEITYEAERRGIDINHRDDDDDDDDDDRWDGPAYVNSDGWFRETDGGWYFYINKTKQYGWISDPDSGSWYYCDRNTGRRRTGWVQEPGGWYYLDSNGLMAKDDWRYVDGNWYYFNSSGAMYSNCWQHINGNWYYFNSSGAALRGWHWIGNDCYYFCTTPKNGFPECAMAYNCIIDGYYVDHNGRWVH